MGTVDPDSFLYLLHLSRHDDIWVVSNNTNVLCSLFVSPGPRASYIKYFPFKNAVSLPILSALLFMSLS